jgi:hypothetical protein
MVLGSGGVFLFTFSLAAYKSKTAKFVESSFPYNSFLDCYFDAVQSGISCLGFP